MASKRRQRLRACERKDRFADQVKAIAALRSLRRRQPTYPGVTYRCGQHWHVGRLDRKARQSRRDRSQP